NSCRGQTILTILTTSIPDVHTQVGQGALTTDLRAFGPPQSGPPPRRGKSTSRTPMFRCKAAVWSYQCFRRASPPYRLKILAPGLLASTGAFAAGERPAPNVIYIL